MRDNHKRLLIARGKEEEFKKAKVFLGPADERDIVKGAKEGPLVMNNPFLEE